MSNPDTRPSLWHDFETYSDLDLKKVGAYKYAMHPSTEVLMAAWAIDDGVVHSWDSTAGDGMPLRELMTMLLDPQIKKCAFNATFEYLIAKHVLDLNVDINDYFCTMAHAWSLSFSGGLAAVGEQVGVPLGKKKLATGSKLIARFCKPAPRNHKAVRYDHISHPAEWGQFLEYNRQDVVAEREIALLFRPYPIHENERALWLLDAEINQRGVPVDRSLIEATLEVSHIEKKRLLERMVALTGLANPNSPVQLRTWLNDHGCALENMQKDTLTAELKYLDGEARDGQLTYEQSQAHEGIVLRQQASKTSTAKWVALKNAMMPDGRVRGMFAFAGAQRTQRWCLTGEAEITVLDEHNRVLGKQIQDVLNSDLVWDGIEFVAHGGVVFSGVREVIEYDGIRATPEHKVFVGEGDPVRLSEARERGLKIETPRSPTPDDVDAARRPT